MRPLRINRRGVTLIEMIVASGAMVLVLFALAGFSRFQSLAWLDVNGDYTTNDQAKLAVQRIAAAIRESRSLVSGSSTATQITAQMPAYDAAGALVVPLQNGPVLSFYLSDTSGDPAHGGSVLWRSVNGAPDAAWSMRGGHGRYVLATSGLSFTYAMVGKPATVTVALTTQQPGGTALRSFSSSQVVVLRNYGL